MPTSRLQQKRRTRRNIIDAAIGMLSETQSFANLSLREVTRKAGIAPTSFYRHFKNMEELGLTLVDQCGLTLRQVLRKARQRITENSDVISISVKTFMEFTRDHPNIFRILFHERSGTTKALREAVAREVRHFEEELSEDIQKVGFDKDTAFAQAEAMVAVIFNAGAETIAAPTGQRSIVEKRAIKQLRFIVSGAQNYRDIKKK